MVIDTMYLFLILLCWGVYAAPNNNAKYYHVEDAHIHFEEFIKTYGKQYENEHVKKIRLQIFKYNLEIANQMNNRSQHATFGITQFMDLTSEEFSKTYTGILKLGVSDIYCPMKTDADIPNSNAPETLDWRQSGYVTPVKDQGTCGSCWSFSATGHIEGQYAKAHGQLVEFSEQQLIDCDTQSLGCQGGLPSAAFQALMQQGGAESEQDYPYTGNQGTCNTDRNKSKTTISSCTSYNLAQQDTVKQLLNAVGPLSICVKSDGFQSYTGGILTDDLCNTGDVNHAVLLVGYGAENGLDYWIVKNSWATIFGEQGYIRIQRNGNSGTSSACGLLNNLMASAEIA